MNFWCILLKYPRKRGLCHANILSCTFHAMNCSRVVKLQYAYFHINCNQACFINKALP